jgi:GDPmannose 4,6-dehydratase
MTKLAFVSGVTGQDGSYLLELLLKKKYIVYGLMRKSSTITTCRIESVLNHENLRMRYGDLTDSSSINRILLEIKKENENISRLEVYNLGAQSHVRTSFEIPEYTTEVNSNGALNLLIAIKNNGLIGITRFYQASTSEMYGKVREIPQNEETAFHPRSPYAVAKLYTYWMVRHYREAYGMHASNGILFNHESPRRGVTFVTRKITTGLRDILENKKGYIELGNIDAKRDWGHAKDYVYGMWLMLQQNTGDDYVLSSDECYSVRDFAEKAFKCKGYDLKWRGSGVDEVGYDAMTEKILIKINKKYYRPTEVDILKGDSKKARRVLNWKPKYTFVSLVKEMVDHDCKNINNKEKSDLSGMFEKCGFFCFKK